MEDRNKIAVDTLANDMKTRGCPVCDRIWGSVFEFFSQWCYALASDEKIQEENAESLGLCPFHSWQMVAMASPQGISKGYVQLLKRFADKLLQLSNRSGNRQDDLAALIKNGDDCRICSLMRKTEADYLKQLKKFISNRENRLLYSASHGLCLRHLSLLAAMVSDPEIGQFLLKEAAGRFEELAKDMENYSLKISSRQRYLLSRDEKDAYIRAIVHIAGGQNVCIQGSNESWAKANRHREDCAE
jgi:hypothetical protein